MTDTLDPSADPATAEHEEETVDTAEAHEAPAPENKPLPRNLYDRAVDAFHAAGQTPVGKAAKWVYQPLGGYSTLPAGRKRQKRFRRVLLAGAALSLFAPALMAGVVGISASGFLAFTMGVLAIEAAHRTYVGVKFAAHHLAQEVPKALSKRERAKNERLKEMTGPEAQVNEPTVSAAAPEATTPDTHSAPATPAAPTTPGTPAVATPTAATPSGIPQFSSMTFGSDRAKAFGTTLAEMQTALRDGSPTLKSVADYQKKAAEVLAANRGLGTPEDGHLRQVLQTIHGAPTVEAVRMTMTLAANTAGLTVAQRHRVEHGLPERTHIPVAVRQAPAAATPRRAPVHAGGGPEIGG